MTASRTVALLSGGLDSVVATALWLERGFEIARCLTFDYGQLASAREHDVAARFCRERQLPWQAVALPWLAELARRAGSALVRPGQRPELGQAARALPEGTVENPGDADSAAAVWVPARNCVFLAVAAAFAEVAGAAVVIAGFNREEAATFPDNSAAFTAAASAFLHEGTRSHVRVESPTLQLDKRAIVAAARRLRIGPGDVWSCYQGGERPCGRCESCCRSERAWAGN